MSKWIRKKGFFIITVSAIIQLQFQPSIPPKEQNIIFRSFRYSRTSLSFFSTALSEKKSKKVNKVFFVDLFQQCPQTKFHVVLNFVLASISETPFQTAQSNCVNDHEVVFNFVHFSIQIWFTFLELFISSSYKIFKFILVSLSREGQYGVLFL